MSFEGWTQNICENGHYYCDNVYVPDGCYCGAKSVWENLVDDTNCDRYGYIPQEFIKQFGDIAQPMSEQDKVKCQTYYHNGETRFINSNELVVLPTYQPCENITTNCVDSYTRNVTTLPPQNNLCE